MQLSCYFIKLVLLVFQYDRIHVHLMQTRNVEHNGISIVETSDKFVMLSNLFILQDNNIGLVIVEVRSVLHC